MSMDYDFYARMVAAQAVAQHERNRGIATGSHPSWKRKRHHEPVPMASKYGISERVHRFREIKAGFREDLHFLMNPELLEDWR